MRRWKWVALLGVLVVLLGACANWRASGPSRSITSISRATFHNLKPGMTLVEVTGILGRPGTYFTREWETDFPPAELPIERPDTIEGKGSLTFTSGEVWQTDTSTVWVAFDSEGNMVQAMFFAYHPSTKSTWRKIGDQCKRLWREWFP
jgi:hypothetical protein